jgi:hypothetical protein
MKRMVSKVNSIPANTTRDIRRLKGQQDNTTERLSGDTTGVLGSGDPDQIQFLTAPFKDLRMMQIGESKGAFGSLALMPDQHASLETPFYSTGTPFPLDRAGTGVFGYNIARTGQPPTGYYGGDKVMIQRRYKIYYNGEDGDPANPFFIYKIDLRAEPKGYELQPGEKLDGGFLEGLRPYGWSFPTDDEGNRLRNVGYWTGETASVVPDNETRPVIDSVDPDFFQLPDARVLDSYEITISGAHLSTLQTALIGPFNPMYMFLPGGIGYWNIIDDNNVIINAPSGMIAGVYDVMVIGSDGQIGVKEQAFTILAAPDPE